MITMIIIFIITIHTYTYTHIHTIAKVKYTDIRNFIDAFLYSQSFIITTSTSIYQWAAANRRFPRILLSLLKGAIASWTLVYRDRSLLDSHTSNTTNR